MLKGDWHEDLYSLCGMGSRNEVIRGIHPRHPRGSYPGATLDELQKNLKEVIELCLEEDPELEKDLPRFVGLQQVEVSK